MNDATHRALILLLTFGLALFLVWRQERATASYRRGTLGQRVYTAEADRRLAERRFQAGDALRGEEFLSRAEDKLRRGLGEKADSAVLIRISDELQGIRKEHAAEVKRVRRDRIQRRMGQAEAPDR
ncbi:MAG: hypothetical protein PHF00_14035 [Elusimicrobia bacterium]|nr:hypothetical protein [Elusimicrobiota bacterium]